MRHVKSIRQLAHAGLLTALLVVQAAVVGAQQTSGTVSGRVVDRVTQQPIVAAQIVIVGTTRGAVTADDGRFRIAAVPVGTHQLRALRIGYQAGAQTITVTAGGTATAEFMLAPAAVQLDVVVTTATGESQRRRETGNAVTTVQPSQERLAVSTNVSQVLQASAPGVTVSQSGGTTGSAPRIRIRGANSVSLSNEPLLIIDGVRASNEITQSNNVGGGVGVGGQVSSRLNDLNPDDIESIEIIKGPAAAALYGTAAANGVIQVRTKRGRSGQARWTVYGEGGTQSDVANYPANFAQVGRNISSGSRSAACTLDLQARRICTPVADSLVSFNPLVQASPFRTGNLSKFGLNVSGGGDVMNYFISGENQRDQGVFDPNKFRRTSLRANLTAIPRPSLNTQLSANYISSRLGFPQNDNNILGIISSGLLGSAFDDPTSRGYLSGQTPREIFAMDTRENVERFVGSGNANWQLLNWLSAVGTAGVDFYDRRNTQTVPPNKVFFGSLPEGQRTANATQIWNYTANGGLTANWEIRPTLRAQTSAGAQFNQEQIQGTRSFGAKLLAGTGSLQGTSARFAVGEVNTDNRTLGAYVQEQLAWRDRLFLTGALRTDKNSAFGQNFGWSKYPAVSASYVISEEDFFPKTDVISSLRLRSAYGKSGQRPNFRDAITFFNAQTVNVQGADVPGIVVGGTGNPDLKPEVSQEFEAGFEAGLFRSRVGFEFNFYTKRTNDLLIARPLPPSLGLTTTQFANLGESSNRGVEVQLNAQVVNTTPFKFDVTVNGSTNTNRLQNLGTLPSGEPIPPIVFGRQRQVQGYPLGGYWDRAITYEDKNKDGIISRVNCPRQAQVPGGPECEITLTDTAVYLGNPLPTREISVNPRLTLFNWLQVTALFDHKGGYKQYNLTERFRCNFGNCRAAYDPSAPLFEQARNLAQLMGSDAGYIEDASYTKLRELAVTLTATPSLASRFRVSGLSLTLAGRNLKTWTNYTGFDPEVNSTPVANFSQSDFLTEPPLRLYTARLTVQF